MVAHGSGCSDAMRCGGRAHPDGSRSRRQGPAAGVRRPAITLDGDEFHLFREDDILVSTLLPRLCS